VNYAGYLGWPADDEKMNQQAESLKSVVLLAGHFNKPQL